jgi:hypothetical protein
VIRALAILAAAATTASAGAPTAPPASSGTAARIAYIAGLLDALAATDHDTLTNTSNYIYAIERNKCQAPDEALHVGCLLEAASRNCAQGARAQVDQCRRASDVIVTNRLGEKAFVPEDVRYEIMESHRDYRTAFARELHRRYAVLVAEFSMSPWFPGSAADHAALAAGLEGYCHEVAGTRGLAWQSCVAAAVWFIASDGRSVTP